MPAIAIEDALIKLAKDQNANTDAVDIGFYGAYGDSGTQKYAGLVRDANASGKFRLFNATGNSNEQPGSTVNFSGFTAGALEVGALECTSLDVANNNITNVGDIDADRLSIADAAQGLQIDASGANDGTFKIIMEDADPSALILEDSNGNDFMIVSTDAGEKVAFKNRFSL